MNARGSRVLRPRNVAVAAVVLLLVWGGWSAFRLLTAAPGAPIDYAPEMAALLERHHGPVGEAPNGWRYVEEAAKIVAGLEAEQRAAGSPPGHFGYIADPALARSPAEFELERRREQAGFRGVERLRELGAFGRLAAAAHAPQARRPNAFGEAGFRERLDMNGHLRALARAASVRMTTAAVRNDSADLVNTFESLLGLGRILMEQGSVIDQLVGEAIVGLAYGRARVIVSDRWASYDTLRGLQRAMDRRSLPTAVFMVEVSRIEGLDALQRLFTDDGAGDGRLVISAFPPGAFDTLTESSVTRRLASGPFPALASLAFAGKAESVATLETFYDGFCAYAALPRWERASCSFDPRAFVAGLSDAYGPVRELLRGKSQLLGGHDRTRLDGAALHTLIAIELHQRLTGAYPGKLEDLVPGVLPELPIDPFTGRPLCYRRLGEDPHGRDYLLYSPGADGVDDGGRAHPDLNQRALNVRGADGSPASPEYDYIVNEPRHPDEDRFWNAARRYADRDE